MIAYISKRQDEMTNCEQNWKEVKKFGIPHPLYHWSL